LLSSKFHEGKNSFVTDGNGKFFTLYLDRKESKIMEPRTKDLTSEAKNLGREAADIASETAQDWSNRTRAAGAAAMETARAAYAAAQSKAVQGAKATDQAIRANPYASLGIAFGAGLLIGFLVKRK
jgi:ElaB/YqjD/DUF883 family membrane-anchored ribosome-binding protein